MGIRIHRVLGYGLTDLARTVCLEKPSPHSTARCEMRKGHDADAPYKGTSPEAAEFLALFHAGRTRGGYWKFWAVEKLPEQGEGHEPARDK
jgi:hypothetical protein